MSKRESIEPRITPEGRGGSSGTLARPNLQSTAALESPIVEPEEETAP